MSGLSVTRFFGISLLVFASCAAQMRSSKAGGSKLGTAINTLALDLYGKLAETSSENIFFSPLSISTVFSMLHYGTRGQTAQELRKVLGYDRAGLTDEEAHASYEKLMREMKGSNSRDYVLRSANAILLDKSMQLIAKYEAEVKQIYQATVKSVDFRHNALQAVSDINSWVSKETNGKIDKIIDELDPHTAMILLNAVYFKGMWNAKFDPRNTENRTFYNNGLDSQQKLVPMMRQKGDFRHMMRPDFQVLELPYKGRNMSMLIFLPVQRNGLDALRRSLDADTLTSIRKKMRPTSVKVSLPKFSVQYSKDLSSEIQALGGTWIFSPFADFTGITPSRAVVSGVIHKAVVEVNEEGSEAAAVTAVVVARSSIAVQMKPHDFTLDRPFLFAIVHEESDAIVFLGDVREL